MKQGWFYNYDTFNKQFVLLKRYYPYYFDRFSSVDEFKNYFSKNLYSIHCDEILLVLIDALKKKVITLDFLYFLFEAALNKLLFKYTSFPDKEDLRSFIFEVFYKTILRFNFSKHTTRLALRIISKINKAVRRYV